MKTIEIDLNLAKSSLLYSFRFVEAFSLPEFRPAFPRKIFSQGLKFLHTRINFAGDPELSYDVFWAISRRSRKNCGEKSN